MVLPPELVYAGIVCQGKKKYAFFFQPAGKLQFIVHLAATPPSAPAFMRGLSPL
jgi:hypothetical protein